MRKEGLAPSQVEQDKSDPINKARQVLSDELKTLFPEDAILVINMRQRDRIGGVPTDQVEDIMIDTKGKPADVLIYLSDEPYDVVRQSLGPNHSSHIYIKLKS